MINKEELIEQLKETLFEKVDIQFENDRNLMAKIGEITFHSKDAKMLTYVEKEEISISVFNSIRGQGGLTSLLNDPEISEIMVNGPGQVFIERKGQIENTDIKFDSIEQLEKLIFSMVGKSDRTVNEASPIVDVRLEDGSRMNIVLRPVAINGPVATIRKFRSKAFTLEELIEADTLNISAAVYLKEAVKSRKNIMVSGGTGAGKTTFLNILGGFIDEGERVITIEDSAELKLYGIKNLVSLESRISNNEGRGKLGIRDLIKASLRMRPDRIIVGEVRGEESLDMLQAMNTGHNGSLSTGHANSAVDMLSRLETMVICGADLPLEAIRRQIASAIDIVVHIERLKSGQRRLAEIVEIQGYHAGEYVLANMKELTEVDFEM